MPYNNLISRTDAAAGIPEDAAADILGVVDEESAALSLFKRTSMSRSQQRMPAISALPVAYFVNGDTGLKQTTEVNWANVYLNAEEIAAIVPVPDNVADDLAFNIWDTVRPLLAAAIARALDAAIFFGTNKPASWPTDIVTAAIAASNTYARGTNNTAAGGIGADLSNLFALVEADGFDVNGLVSNRNYRGLLRNYRDSQGRFQNLAATDVYGVTPRYPMRGIWPATATGVAEAIAGDFTQGVIAVRQDLTWMMLDQAVIQDNTGAIQFNLAQQDMKALRVTARYAWAVPNPINRDNTNPATRYPFAVMTAP